MPRRSFLVRLLIPFIALWAVVSVASLGLTAWVARGSVYLDQVRTLESAAAAVRRAASPTELRVLAAAAGCRLTVIEADGRVGLDTAADAAHMPNHNDRPEVIDARRLGVGQSSRASQTLGLPAVYLATRADGGGTVVRVCYAHDRWASLQTPLWTVTITGAAVTAVMLALLGLILQKQWVTPTRAVSAAAARLASGHWDARVEPRGSDDVRHLATRLNHLAEQAGYQLAELKRQRRDLRSLVDALPDPILVTDPIGRVELVNLPAADLVEMSPSRLAGQQAVAVITDEAILRLLDSAGDVAASWETPPVYSEVRLVRYGHRRTYQSFAAHTHTGGSLLVLRDVTAMADAVQMKTDFVANASHELRTPLAAIKIALETLHRRGRPTTPPQGRALRERSSTTTSADWRRFSATCSTSPGWKAPTCTARAGRPREALGDIFAVLRSAARSARRPGRSGASSCRYSERRRRWHARGHRSRATNACSTWC